MPGCRLGATWWTIATCRVTTMLEVVERLGLDCDAAEFECIELNHEQRTRGRLRTVSTQGSEVGLFLERGRTLQVGEFLRSRCGMVLRIDGAEEDVAVARCDDWDTFSRACYHLGNRHVKVQIGSRWLAIVPDHVLEAMLQGLGMTLTRERHVFNPESGAYAHGHDHASDGGSTHGHGHDHHEGQGNAR